MAQLDYGLMAQAKDKDNYQVGADVAKTFEDEAGSITPSFNFGKGSSTTEYPDGAVVDKDDNQIGFSLNGNLFLDDKGKNSLRAGVGRRSTSSDENVTMPEGETVSFSGGENLTSFSLGGDLGNFIFDLSKNISDKSKIDFTSGRIRYKIGDNAEIYLEDTNTSDPTIGYKFSKSFAEGGVIPQEEEDTGFFSRVKDTVGDITFKDAATFVAEATPIIGDAMAAKEVYDELQKDDPNYLLAGALGGAAIIGLIPGIGDVAAAAIKKGARSALSTAKRVEVDPDALGSLGGNIRLKPVDTQDLSYDTSKNTPSVEEKQIDLNAAEELIDDRNLLDEWKKENNIPDKDRPVNPAAKDAQDLYDEKITSKELRTIIQSKLGSPKMFTLDDFPEMPSIYDTVGGMGAKAKKFGIIGVKGFDLEPGQRLGSRLDINAYNNYNKWIVSIHDGTKEKGSVLGYGQAIRLKNIDFSSDPQVALDIARKKVTPADPVKGTKERIQNKSTIARIHGDYVPQDPYEIYEEAKRRIDDPEWTQAGMNPDRGSYFYDKKTGLPILHGDDMLQVGPLVLIKNVETPKLSELKKFFGGEFKDGKYTTPARTKSGKIKAFNEGGEIMDDQGNAQMEMELMLKEQIDPVSGNTAPLGATPEEVRDDVPINASAGEFMINAQTLNYFGEEFFNNLQETAAEGWERIKSGEESFFRDDELEVEDADSEEAMPTDMPTDLPQGMAYGGRVRGYAEGDKITDEIANTEVPKPVGGGYGGYGGTGSTFTGFEMRIVKDPTTGRTKKVAFFNGRPLAPLESYVDVSSEGGDTASEGSTIKRNTSRDEETDVFTKTKNFSIKPENFRDKPNVNTWTDQDFNSYSNNTIEGKEGKFSSGESTILQMVGNSLLLGSGGFGLTALAKRLNRKQAIDVYKHTKDKIEKGEGTNPMKAANKAAYNTARNLHMETYPDMFGVGFLDGPDKRNTLAEDHAFFKEYEKPQDPSTLQANEYFGLENYTKKVSPGPVLDNTKKDGYLRGGDNKVVFKDTSGQQYVKDLFGRAYSYTENGGMGERMNPVGGIETTPNPDGTPFGYDSNKDPTHQNYEGGSGAQLNDAIRGAGIELDQWYSMSDAEKNSTMKNNSYLKEKFSRHSSSRDFSFA